MGEAAQSRWQTWTDDGCYRTFRSFAAAEKHARKIARPGNPVEIKLGFREVANVRVDALDRVWTDVVATELV